jgi:dihydroorotate dehydrogenase (NAD+) catalytic subunit
VEIGCSLAGVVLPSPLVLASGILGTHASLLERVARRGAGAVTAKSCTPAPRAGHPNPTVVEWGHGLINAVGLPNRGVLAEVEMLRRAGGALRPLGVPLIASIFAETPRGFGEVAKMISSAGPDMIELNVSCPNVHADFGEPLAASPKAVREVTRVVKSQTGIPVAVKLSPNVPDIGAIAEAAAGAGADAITAVNTMPGMLVDAESGFPILANREGGISGPAVKPIALRCVYRIFERVSVPIIGSGGVLTGTDAVEMVMAGATAVGIGSALHYRGMESFRIIAEEIRTWLADHGYTSLGDIRGMAHRCPTAVAGGMAT